ncbi:unnamed protein product [Heterobilharzia americana]|nr:unnamed protein product [Heterobilharzia americana]
MVLWLAIKTLCGDISVREEMAMDYKTWVWVLDKCTQCLSWLSNDISIPSCVSSSTYSLSSTWNATSATCSLFSTGNVATNNNVLKSCDAKSTRSFSATRKSTAWADTISSLIK